MVETIACPICDDNSCTREDTTDFYSLIRCQQGHKFFISDDISTLPKIIQDKLYNLIFELIIRRPTSDNNKLWYFFFDPTHEDDVKPPLCNLADVIQTYPTNIIERTNRTLLNLSIIHPKYGDIIGVEYLDVRASYCEGDEYASELRGVLRLMEDMRYFNYINDRKTTCAISADGWKKVEELYKRQQEIKQGFIAMSFRAETNSIREAFRAGITQSGYSVRIIDEKEHNNQIVPEIFYEIERSKFIVVDITYPNFGAYYEAGYAQGLGKQVIVCCNKVVFENKDDKYVRPHFDISQKSMIIWDDEADLVARLKRRIEATVK